MKTLYLQILVIFTLLSIVLIVFYSLKIITTENANFKLLFDFNNKNIKLSSEINEQKNLEGSSNVDKKSQEQQIIDFYNTISTNELKVYSQNKEDGVTVTIFNLLNIKDLKKYYVEIGTENGKKKHVLKYN